MRFSRSIVWAVLVCALALCVTEARAVQRATNYVGVSNDNNTTGNGKWANLVNTTNGSGLPQETNYSKSFTGIDQSESPRTMTFSAQLSAWSQWGVLKSSMNASVVNAFYNPEDNDPYYDINTSLINPAGVPDIFNAEATASFSERLVYGGFATNYTSRYFFRLTGKIEGDGYTHVLIRHGTNPIEHLFFNNEGDYNQIIASSTYVNSGNEFFSVTIQTGFLAGIDYVEDGDSISGSANFGNTLELIAVEARDNTGALLPQGSVVGEESGMSYVVAVPEPGSLSLAAIAGLLALRRRR